MSLRTFAMFAVIATLMLGPSASLARSTNDYDNGQTGIGHSSKQGSSKHEKHKHEKHKHEKHKREKHTHEKHHTSHHETAHQTSGLSSGSHLRSMH